MVIKTELVILGLAVLLAIVGLFIVLKASFLFKRTPDDVLRAKVFLAKPFLYRNLIIIFMVSTLVSLHTVLEFIDYGVVIQILIPYASNIHIIYSLTLAISMFLLALLAYYWCKLLSSPKS